ncbi:hypothetical protein FGE58_15935 [Salmonella enterica]|nr:hypothetical protein [Salmonella enterica]
MLVGILKNLLLTHLLVISELLTHTVLFHKRFKMIEHELNTKRLRSIKLQFPQNLIFNELIDCMFAMLNPEQARYINEKIALTPDTWIYQTTIDALNSLMNKEQFFFIHKEFKMLYDDEFVYPELPEQGYLFRKEIYRIFNLELK